MPDTNYETLADELEAVLKKHGLPPRTELPVISGVTAMVYYRPRVTVAVAYDITQDRMHLRVLSSIHTNDPFMSLRAPSTRKPHARRTDARIRRS